MLAGCRCRNGKGDWLMICCFSRRRLLPRFENASGGARLLVERLFG
jgi:hypothetical protein